MYTVVSGSYGLALGLFCAVGILCENNNDTETEAPKTQRVYVIQINNNSIHTGSFSTKLTLEQTRTAGRWLG